MTGSRRGELLFGIGCALFYAFVVLVTPSYTPLIEPDSGYYIAFDPFRPAYYPAFLALCRSLGLGLVATTWVQLTIFSAALAYLVVSLARVGFQKYLLAAMVIVLAANPLFSSFHRSILSDSLFYSLSVVALALWIDYFHRKRLGSLAGAGFFLGLMIGFRLAGLGLLPFHLLTIFIRRPRAVPLWVCFFVAIVPPIVGAGGERVLYYAVHRSNAISQAPYLLFAKAALLIKPGMHFSGPHAAAFFALGDQLLADYGNIQRIVAEAPNLPVRAQLSQIYEGLAQYSLMTDAIERTARAENISAAKVRSDFATQVILQNFRGYVALTALNDFGQWSVAAQKFPAIARAMSAYANTHPDASAGGRVANSVLYPTGSLTGLVIYPVFLAAGLVTLVLAFAFIIFVVRPSLATTPAGFYLLIASFLSAACHGYTLFISIVNLWTPRFLMAVFPHLEIIGLCLVMAAVGYWRSDGTSSAELISGK